MSASLNKRIHKTILLRIAERIKLIALIYNEIIVKLLISQKKNGNYLK